MRRTKPSLYGLALILFIIFSLSGGLYAYQEVVTCPGFLPSRLIVGEQGMVSTSGSANNVRDSAGTSGTKLGEIPPGGAFIVLEGPACAGGLAWWRVDYNGLIGWTAEGSGGEYWLEPLGPLPTQAPSVTPIETSTPEFPVGASCPGFMPSRLIVGEQGRVIPGPANALRSHSTSSSQRLGEIPGGATFLILEGPICSGGLAWWRVDYRGTVGWTAEGSGDEYWLEPAGPLPTLAPTLTPSITPTPYPTLTPSLTPSPVPQLPPLAPLPPLDSLMGSTLPEGYQPITTANVSGLRPLTIIGNGGISDISWSANGETVALLSSLGVWVQNADHLDQLGTRFEIPHRLITAIALSPDGKLLAAGSVDADGQPTVHVWDIATQTLLPEFAYSETRVSRLTFSPDGELLAVGSAFRSHPTQAVTLSIWKVENGDRVPLPQYTGGVGHLVFSPDSKLIAFRALETNVPLIHIWDIELGQSRITYESLGGLGEIAFSPDGTLLAAAGGGGGSATPGVLRLWDLSTAQRVPGPSFEQLIWRFAFQPRGQLIAVVGGDNRQIYLWNVAQGRLETTLELSNPIGSIAFSPDGTTLATAENNMSLRLWDIEARESRRAAEYGFDPALLDAVSGYNSEELNSFIPGIGDLLPSDQTAELLTLARSYTGSRSVIVYQAMTVPNTSMLALNDGKTLQFWDTTTRLPVAQMEFYGEIIGFNAEGTLMLSRTNGAIWVWGIAP